MLLLQMGAPELTHPSDQNYQAEGRNHLEASRGNIVGRIRSIGTPKLKYAIILKQRVATVQARLIPPLRASEYSCIQLSKSRIDGLLLSPSMVASSHIPEYLIVLE